MFFLGQDITRKRRLEEKTAEQIEFEASSNNEEYKVKDIRNSAVYARELKVGHLPSFYYLISWKDYSESENICEPISVVQQFRKLISTFYKNYSNKLIVTSVSIDVATPIAKYTTPPNINGKRKHGRLVGSM